MKLIADNIVRKYGKRVVVKGVSFEVNQGEIVGLLGPNGAGKTTTIRMITNILYPDKGEIQLFGEKSASKHSDQIGYLPEERGLYKKLKVIDQIAYFGMLKGMSRQAAVESGKLWLKKLDASDWQNKKVYNELSDPKHPVAIAMERQKLVKEVRIIEGVG